MAHKKPSPTPALPPAGAHSQSGRGKPARRTLPQVDNPRLQGDNRWQRTKRYGWNSR